MIGYEEVDYAIDRATVGMVKTTGTGFPNRQRYFLLLTSYFPLPISCFLLLTSHFPFLASYRVRPTSHFLLLTAYILLPASYCLLLSFIRLVAVHEAGHAVCGLLSPDYDMVTKVTIIPRCSPDHPPFYI